VYCEEGASWCFESSRRQKIKYAGRGRSVPLNRPFPKRNSRDQITVNTSSAAEGSFESSICICNDTSEHRAFVASSLVEEIALPSKLV
jgi:hypothetical protein